MTKQEFLEKYRGMALFFDSYYKYRFTFSGIEFDTGNEVTITFGGNSSDIYRLELSNCIQPKVISSLFDEDDWEFSILTEFGDVIVKG